MELMEHWADFPPPSEVLQMLAVVFTDWRPQGKRKVSTPEQMTDAVLAIGGTLATRSDMPEWLRISIDAAMEGRPN
jgi:hypothetical protein